MTRQLLSALIAFLVTLVVFGGNAGSAAAATAHYQAEPATAQPQARLIVKDLIWKCGSGTCVAGKSNSRPLIDCSALVRQVGALRSFTVQGHALTAAELEKCNARAR